MFNRHVDDSQHNNNYQSVSVNVAPSAYTPSQSAPLVSLAVFGMFVIAGVGLAVIVYRLITDTLEILAGVLVALLTTVAALAPWLIGGGALLALGIVALRSLPEAIEEAAAIRRHYIAARQPMMLEVKDVDYSVVTLRPVRAVDAVDTEQ